MGIPPQKQCQSRCICIQSLRSRQFERRVIYFGKYELLSRINIGGMAEIVRARDTSDGNRIVAIKRILPHLCSDEHYRAMFMDESRLLAQLDHPSIVRAQEASEIDGTPYIALEYVQGQDAREVFSACERAGQPLPLGIACYVIARLCEGLQFVHDRVDERGKPLGIVHRDVSLQNLLLGYDGDVKLTDFGIAVSEVNEVHTEAGIVKGKFGYMSPEQIRGAKLDRRTDVFATGICLYELLTGERLFSGENDYKAIERVRQADVPRPSSRNRQIPASLEKIVLKALSKNPRDRHPSANDLRRALQGFLAESNLFIERADLGKYLKALFEQEYLAAKQQEAEEQAHWARPESEPPTVKEEELDEPTVVAAKQHLITEAEERTATLTDDDLAASATNTNKVIPAGPERFDMDWDEQEPTTISQGFRDDAPLMSELSAARKEDARVEPAAPDKPSEPARDAASSISPGRRALRRQRSLPTLELRRPRDVRGPTIALAGACSAVAVFVTVYVLQGRGEAGIRIDTEPRDATVHVDGRKLPGEGSPYIATKLSSGERHTIVVERAGHGSWSTTLKLPAGEILTLPTVRLAPVEPVPRPHAREAQVDDEPQLDARDEMMPAQPPPAKAPTAAPRSSRRASTTQGTSVAVKQAVSPRPASAPEKEVSARNPAEVQAGGGLRINTRPWTKVSVDGVFAGNTPQTNIKVAAGTHALLLENPEFGITQKLSITVKPGETVTRVLNLKP